MTEPVINDEYIEKAENEESIVRYVRRYFRKNTLSLDKAKLLVRLILNNNNGTGKPINVNNIDAGRGFTANNGVKLDVELFRKEVIDELSVNIKEQMAVVHKDLDLYEDDSITIETGTSTYKVKAATTVRKILEVVTLKGVDATFKYDFEHGDLPLIKDLENIDTMQRCLINITVPAITFGFPIRYTYDCPECNKGKDPKEKILIKRNFIDVGSVNRIACGNIRTIVKGDGDVKDVVCSERLSPMDMEGNTIDAFYYQAITIKRDESEMGSADDEEIAAMSFRYIVPGQYEAVVCKMFSPKALNKYFIIDVKSKIEKAKIVFPEKVQGENYLLTLARGFDDYITQQSGKRIWGLMPIKAALILQAGFSYFNWNLLANINLVGMRGTGKSMILNYWGPLLYGDKYYTAPGNSISIPTLRGTEIKLNLLGKDISTLSKGYLGTFRSITIDEAGQNVEVINDLKSFIYESEYSMDKKGGKGVKHKRLAHINLTSNPNILFRSNYVNDTKKLYVAMEEMSNPESPTDKLAKPDWDERWDLHLDLKTIGRMYTIRTAEDKVYPNFYLINAVEKKRQECYEKDKWWIDGMDMAVHDRFPFYFYLDAPKVKNRELQKINIENTIRSPIETRSDLINLFDTDSVKDFFKNCKEYEEAIGESEAFDEVTKILEENYDLMLVQDTRIEGFFQLVLKASRMINKRKEYTTEDFDLVKWFLQTTNRKINTDDISCYSLNPGGPAEPIVCALLSPSEKKTYTSDEAFGDYRGLVDDLPKGSWKT